MANEKNAYMASNIPGTDVFNDDPTNNENNNPGGNATPDNPDTPDNPAPSAGYMVPETTFADIRKIADINRTSVNDIINELLNGYIAEHAADIEKYNAVFGE